MRVLVGAIAAILLVAGWSYCFVEARRMFQRYPKHRSCKLKQVQLVDILAFFVVASLPLTFMSIAIKWNNPIETEVVCGLALVGIFVVVWWEAVKLLSSQNISEPGRRFLFLAVLQPGMVVGGFLAPVALLALPAAYVELGFPTLQWELSTYGLAAAGALFGLGNRWVAAGAGDPEELKESPD